MKLETLAAVKRKTKARAGAKGKAKHSIKLLRSRGNKSVMWNFLAEVETLKHR